MSSEARIGDDAARACKAATLTLGRAPNSLTAIALRGSARAPTALVFVHGAGLDPLAPLYLEIASGLTPIFDTYLVGLRASGFLTYNSGFRKPRGWAHHLTTEALADLEAWLARVADEGHDSVVLGGHSWGALLSLQARVSEACLRGFVLISPLPSIRDLIRLNFGDEHRLKSLDLEHLAPDASVPTVEGAPLPFLTAKTIRSLLAADWTTSEPLRRATQPALVAFGAAEHSALRDAALSLAAPGRDIVEIPGQGHFYTTGVDHLVAQIARWWHGQRLPPRQAAQ